MKINSGVDILNIQRFQKKIERHGQKFLEKFLTHQEISETTKLESLAGLFAAKEAASKALGTGIGQKQVSWHDFEIRHNNLGKPNLELNNGAKEIFDELGGIHIDLSISHEKEYVVAFCLVLMEE